MIPYSLRHRITSGRPSKLGNYGREDIAYNAIIAALTAPSGLSYYDALTDMELRDTTLPPNAVRRLPDGRLLLRDGSIIGK